MAVDTATKRSSVIQFAMPFRISHPVPDASVGNDDKLHLLALYAGIDPSAPGGFSAYWARFTTQVTGPAGMGPTNHA